MHYVVLGFGVVSVPKLPRAVTVTKVQVLGGVLANDAPGVRVSAGLVHGMAVSIPVEADVQVEVSEKPFGPLKISTVQVGEQDP